MAKNRKRDKVERVTIKASAKSDKRSAKADLIDAKARKSLATAQKRKWLVILIIVAIGAFYAIKSGGINFGGIIDKVKGYMP